MTRQSLYQPVDDLPKAFESEAALRAWIVQQAQPDMALLLAHADDGVIWGKVVDQNLALAGDAFSEVRVALHPKTLQQLRLFGPVGELLIWQTAEGFAGRLIADGKESPSASFEDHQWLWGTRNRDKDDPKGIFTLLVDGKQGLRHAPPITGLGDDRVMLTLRHYVDYDAEGQAHIIASRLTGLQKAKER